MTRTLAVRLDNDGDVLLTGPALRALAAGSSRLDLLVSPAGSAAAALLPDVDNVVVFDAPWSGFVPPPTDVAALKEVVERMARYDLVVIFTSYHQSPLPMALLARTAGVGRVAAASEDYPGSLLDVRHRRESGPEVHEVVAALDLARAAGFSLPAGDDGRLRVRGPLPDVAHLLPAREFVVLHPGASVPARAPSPARARAHAEELVEAGWDVVITGSAAETRDVVGSDTTDLSGRTSLGELAGVLATAACVVVGNTGPAHLAAAVGTPVVSLFAPVVPAARWVPYGVRSVILGDQDAPCWGSRARICPVPGHPCLDGITPGAVVAAVGQVSRVGVGAR